MKCPYCGGVLKVVNTYKADPFIVRRRRVCVLCKSVIYTTEVFEEGLLINGGYEKEYAVIQNGEKEKGCIKEENS